VALAWESEQFLGPVRAQRVDLRLHEIGELLAIRDRGLCPCGHTAKLLRQRMAEIDQRSPGSARSAPSWPAWSRSTRSRHTRTRPRVAGGASKSSPETGGDSDGGMPLRLPLRPAALPDLRLRRVEPPHSGNDWHGDGSSPLPCRLLGPHSGHERPDRSGQQRSPPAGDSSSSPGISPVRRRSPRPAWALSHGGSYVGLGPCWVVSQRFSTGISGHQRSPTVRRNCRSRALRLKQQG
jgi:MerR, DNA binding